MQYKVLDSSLVIVVILASCPTPAPAEKLLAGLWFSPRPTPSTTWRSSAQTMERSTTFTAVSGWGYVAMGVTALVAAPSRCGRPRRKPGWQCGWPRRWWRSRSALVAMHWKASRLGTPILSVSGRRLFVGLLPALFAGGVMTVALVRAGDPRQIPGVWLLLYGVAVMQAGAFSVRTIPIMGAVFVLAGAIALPLPWCWANVMLAVGFGMVHIVFGAYIARRHGG